MPRTCDISISPKWLNNTEELERLAARKLGVAQDRVQHSTIIRRSIDARKRQVKYNLRLQLWIDEEYFPTQFDIAPYQDVHHAGEVLIAGMGPAGLFAALKLIQQGIKPVIIERGKAVRERRRDLADITRNGIVNPNSNYCFGEGGAGTFSDGKLYTRSTKRGNTRRILETLVHFGATREILVDAHPHIGTNKLPRIIQNMREQILAAGGKILFDTRLTDLIHEAGELKAAVLNEKTTYPAKNLILATGHSARDIFELLHRHQLTMEAKPFALGVRVEHPQGLIDEIQYHCEGPRHENLPAAAYSLVRQVDGKGVYSFCMCPGGIICPAATQSDEIVVNGWSPSKRNSPYANSGIVVAIGPKDIPNFDKNPLAGIAYQQKVEQKAFAKGGGKQVAPAQRLADFVKGKSSSSLPDCSYLPGLSPINLREVLPKSIHNRLRGGFRAFGKKLKGYLTNEAVVVAVESRTSSPIRIPRDKGTLMHPQLKGLYPCGEGAGYAGGIMSAAIDGERCAAGVVERIGG